MPRGLTQRVAALHQLIRADLIRSTWLRRADDIRNLELEQANAILADALPKYLQIGELSIITIIRSACTRLVSCASSLAH